MMYQPTFNSIAIFRFDNRRILTLRVAMGDKECDDKNCNRGHMACNELGFNIEKRHNTIWAVIVVCGAYKYKTERERCILTNDKALDLYHYQNQCIEWQQILFYHMYYCGGATILFHISINY